MIYTNKTVTRLLPLLFLMAFAACADWMGLSWEQDSPVMGFRIYGQRGYETRLLGWSTQTCWEGTVESPGLWRFHVTAVDTNLVESEPSNILTGRIARLTLLRSPNVTGPWETNCFWWIVDAGTNTFWRSGIEW